MNARLSCRRPWLRAVALTVLACAASHVCVEAGVGNVPCTRPFVFKDAAVNVVVLPYESPPELGRDVRLGERLAGLVQLEALRSIAKFGSVGTVQMVGSPTDCAPDLVASKLLGKAAGAEVTLASGQALILVWGRFFSRDGTLFVQSYCRFLRAGVDETFVLMAGGQQFRGQLSAQAFACAPRRVTLDDLTQFERQFYTSTLVREEPRDEANGTPMPPEPVPYWVSDIQGDWMKIGSQRGLNGWIRLSGARDAWSLARLLPEVLYVEGMAGFLRHRVSQPTSSPSGSPRSWGSPRDGWLDAASRALAEYEQAIALPTTTTTTSGGVAPVLPWRTALAGAVQLQMRGMAMATKAEANNGDRVTALRLFERAAAAIPHDGHANNLVAITKLGLAFSAADSGVSPKDAAADLLRALSADPGNRLLVTNLRTAYQLLLSPAAPKTFAVSDEERRTYGEQLAALSQVR
jgi:hypothetical protein